MEIKPQIEIQTQPEIEKETVIEISKPDDEDNNRVSQCWKNKLTSKICNRKISKFFKINKHSIIYK